MLFNDIIGQEEIKRGLTDMVVNQRVSHALLFYGSEGSGHLALAVAFAQYLLVVSQPKHKKQATNLFSEPKVSHEHHDTALPLPNEIADNATYKRLKKFGHPDLHFCFPFINKKPDSVSDDFMEQWKSFLTNSIYGNLYDWLQLIGAENQQANITAKEVKDIFRKLHLTSFEGGYKILIIWLPEFLGKEGNKLLKLIEEPPAGTIFILVANNTDLILPTILSRCQTIKIPRLTTKEIATALHTQLDLSTELANNIATVSNGNYREAVFLAQNVDNTWIEIIKNWMNKIFAHDLVGQINIAEELSALGREKQKYLLLYFINLIEQAVYCIVMGEKGIQVTNAEKDFVIKLTKITHIGTLEVFSKELENAIYYIERNASSKMLFQTLSFKFFYLLKEKKQIILM
ncbi:MAG: hypothetical protein QM528_09250 [Phycisphaerales bacterium]|nr:hypothetical protein [Phycisphaerales bacterium]